MSIKVKAEAPLRSTCVGEFQNSRLCWGTTSLVLAKSCSYTQPKTKRRVQLKHKAKQHQKLQEIPVLLGCKNQQGERKKFQKIESKLRTDLISIPRKISFSSSLITKRMAQTQKTNESTNLLSRVAKRMVNAVICVAVFHFPKLFTATA